jgi:hypothetical protein
MCIRHTCHVPIVRWPPGDSGQAASVTFPRHRRRQFESTYMPPVTPTLGGNTSCIVHNPPFWDTVPSWHRCSHGRRIRRWPAVSRPHEDTKVVLRVGVCEDVCGGVSECRQGRLMRTNARSVEPCGQPLWLEPR